MNNEEYLREKLDGMCTARLMALNIASVEFDDDYIVLNLENEHRFLVKYDIQYIVNGRKARLYANDLDLLDRLGIDYQQCTPPIYFSTDKVLIAKDYQGEYIYTGSKLIGVFKPSVYVRNIRRGEKRLDCILT